MKASAWVTGVAFLLLSLATPAGTYSLYGQRWPSGSIVMQLQLSGSSGALIDGATSWNAVAEGALAAWNQVMGGAQFQVVRDSTASIGERDGLNNVFWASDVYGDAFDDAIAVTTYRFRGSTLIEADVIFNNADRWNSYRGNQRNASGGRLYDLRRVALHEFGHVLGLDHPDEAGQSVTAIMNSRVSSLDALQTDDINGARAIYGAPAASANRAPSVTASCSPCTVEIGQTSDLQAVATDADGDALTYVWTAADGTFTGATSASATWRAPLAPGSLTATVTVQDGRGGSATATVTLQFVLRDRLIPGARLASGQFLVSSNGRFRLVYQSDGNLVIYDDDRGADVWSSRTVGSAGQAAMQADGNLVLYDAQGRAVWSTGTAANPAASLLLQTDGNLVIYSSGGQPLWNRFTAR